MWITKKPWCDYMAVKLPHENPGDCAMPEVLLKRVYYSRQYVKGFMKPKLDYFMRCLKTRTRPVKDYYVCNEVVPSPDVHDLLAM